MEIAVCIYIQVYLYIYILNESVLPHHSMRSIIDCWFSSRIPKTNESYYQSDNNSLMKHSSFRVGTLESPTGGKKTVLNKAHFYSTYSYILL